MDPSERLSCAQLIEHAYFEQSRLHENYDQLWEEHGRRMRAEKHKMNRQRNQRARVSQVSSSCSAAVSRELGLLAGQSPTLARPAVPLACLKPPTEYHAAQRPVAPH